MMKRLTLPLLLSMFLLSCSYQTRFENLVRNHPDLNNHVDTIEVETKVHTPAISMDTTLKIKSDTVADSQFLDNLFTILNANDSLQTVINGLKKGVVKYYQTKKCFEDTIKLEQEGFKFKIYQTHYGLAVLILRPAKEVATITKVPVKKIIVNQLTKQDKFKIGIFNWLWLVILIAAIIISILYLWKKP